MTELTTKRIDKLHLKIGGMQCSFCVSSIEKALSKIKGVKAAAVSLAHEEVLIQYDPDAVAPQLLRDTLRSLGYTVRGPRKVRSFEEEETELRFHRHQLLIAVGGSILKMAWASFKRGILNQHVLMEFGAFGGLIGGAVGFFTQPWPMADFVGAAIFITAYLYCLDMCHCESVSAVPRPFAN